MERLIGLDKQLLLAINHWTSPWADALMVTMSKVTVWFPLYLLVAAALCPFFSRRALVAL